jgi:hypothetical protein
MVRSFSLRCCGLRPTELQDAFYYCISKLCGLTNPLADLFPETSGVRLEACGNLQQYCACACVPWLPAPRARNGPFLTRRRSPPTVCSSSTGQGTHNAAR